MADGGKSYTKQFGIGKRDNISFTINAGVSVTLYFRENGTDSDTEKYWNLGSEAKIVSIVNNKIATITHIDGQELKSPKTLGTANANNFTNGFEWASIVVAADQDATTFEVYAS